MGGRIGAVPVERAHQVVGALEQQREQPHQLGAEISGSPEPHQGLGQGQVLPCSLRICSRRWPVGCTSGYRCRLASEAIMVVAHP